MKADGTSTRHLRLLRHLCAVALLFAAGQDAGLADASDVVEIDNYPELTRHSPSNPPVITLPWLDEAGDVSGGGWQFAVKVDESGRVVSADFMGGLEQQRPEALAVVLGTRFVPFEKDGRFVKAAFPYFVEGRTADYVGPANRAFPGAPVPADSSIKLRRTGCFGPCPAYEIEVRGDGQVSYHGISDVLITGTHQWRTSAAAVADLMGRFRRARYFTLDGYYVVDATDLPSYVTQVRIGRQRKFVYDYGGGGLGEAFASTSFGGRAPSMPAVVTELEDAVDVLSGANSWTQGDDQTIAALERARWDFKSKQAGIALQYLLFDCKVQLARDFLARGAPLSARGENWSSGAPINLASRCADVQLVQMLESKGALSSKKDAEAYLFASVESGDPDMVRVALRHQHDTNIKNSDGEPLLSIAAQLTEVEEGDPRFRSFDAGSVIRMLVDAGADVNARDSEGNAPLHEVFDVNATRALLHASADPSARNSEGRTPVFNRYADAESLKLLVKAGADINATDPEGYVPLDVSRTEADALDRMALGARPSRDPVRLRKFIDHAKENGWTRVLAELQ